MKKRLAALIAAGVIATTLAGCSGDAKVQVQQANVKVDPQTQSCTYVRFRNGYHMGSVEIIDNSDGTYTVCIEAVPPETYLSN